MKLREVIIKNFRCLVDIRVPITDTTVLVGENNSGKTTLLEALQIVIPRTATTRGRPFNEYDYHMCKAGDSPENCEGIVIEVWFREDTPNEWPDSLIQALTEIIQTDPVNDLDSIGLRLSSKYDTATKDMVHNWEFLTLDGQPLRGKGASPVHLNRFYTYVRLFYLSALRDSAEEFTPRSQFWGRILRDLKISEEKKENLAKELAKLNDELLKADPRLEQVRAALDKIKGIVALETGEVTSIQVLPLRTWDLMSKAQVAIRGRGSEIEFPLSRHGHGVQSLAVLFLFQAYIDVFLKPMFEPETEAILALEEPETHLHPQATRALAANLQHLTSQKTISTHSPYFIQEIDFADIRLFRLEGPCSKVLYVRQSFSCNLPDNHPIRNYCLSNAQKFSYNSITSTLTIKGCLEKQEYRDLLALYPGQQDVHQELKRLGEESKLYISNDDLVNLNTYAKRIRGEVLFARAWLLCEGQSEYLLLRYFAELLEKPLDQAGVTVIDFQNNGSPGAFVGLARVFQIPWIMVCDNDQAGHNFVRQVKDRGLTDQEIGNLVRTFPDNNQDLELFLLKNGFMDDYEQLIDVRGLALSKEKGETGYEDELVDLIQKHKTDYVNALIAKLRSEGANASRVPDFFVEIIEDVVAEAAY